MNGEIESSGKTEKEDRQIYVDEELERLYGIDVPEIPLKTKLKTYCTCSRDTVKNGVLSAVPILKWLPQYNISKQLVKDVAAGCTLGVVNLPQGMAYALLASVPPIYGLYTSFFPVLFFAIFSTSKHVSIGTFAVVTMMVGDVVDKTVPPPACLEANPDQTTIETPLYTENTTISSSSCEQDYEERKVQVSIALAVAVGLIQLIMRVLYLGIIRIYLSTYLIAAFTCGAAFHVFTSQVSKILGISVPRQSGPFAIIYTYIDIFSKIGQTNPWAVLVSACSIIFLIIGKEINMRYKKQLPFPIPWELAVIIFATLASYYGLLYENHDVVIVGDIPTGIQVMMPLWDDIVEVLTGSIAIAIVVFAVEISLAQMFATQHSYDVDANQELVALGLANIFSSFFGCFPCASSLSRTAIWDEIGGHSQIVGVVSSGIILTILLWLGPLFESLPQAALGSIIIVNLKRLLFQLNQISPLWKINKVDSITWVVTWVAVILFGVAVGLGIAIAFEIFMVVVKTQISHGVSLGKIAMANTYASIKHYKIDKNQDSSTLIFKPTMPLYFANKESFSSSLNEALGFDPAREIYCNEGFVDIELDEIDKKQDSQKNFETNLYVNNNQTTKNLKFLILDMSASPFIDNDGAKEIKALFSRLKGRNITLLLCCCTVDIRHGISMHCEKSKPLFFISLDGAMEYVSGNTKFDIKENDKDYTAEADVKSLHSCAEAMRYSLSSASSNGFKKESTKL